jgi:hypothetical protein
MILFSRLGIAEKGRFQQPRALSYELEMAMPGRNGMMVDPECTIITNTRDHVR